jgi:ethanolamine utilization protein EutP
MKRLMLIGETGAGKRSLIRALSGEALPPRLPMSVEFHGPFINTPGEFLENRRFYRHLITAAVDCDIVAFVQDATRRASLFPPLFAASFNRKLVGVVSKTDAEGADPERAERLLRNAGAKDIFRMSVQTGDGLEKLRALLV